MQITYTTHIVAYRRHTLVNSCTKQKHLATKTTTGALRARGARPKAAPLLSLLNMMIMCLHIWILCMIISISHLFGMIFQIMRIIPYLSPLEPFQTLVKFTRHSRSAREYAKNMRLHSYYV